MAGAKLYAAVPEVHTSATGRWSCRAIPSATKAALRSSLNVRTVIPGSRAKASVSGAHREPGQRTTWSSPFCRHIDATRLMAGTDTSGEAGGQRIKLHFRLLPLAFGDGVGCHACAGIHERVAVVQLHAPQVDVDVGVVGDVHRSEVSRVETPVIAFMTIKELACGSQFHATHR